MNAFTHISPEKLGNTFDMIGKDWMLITARDAEGKCNTMTASWGCFGVLWNKPVCVCFIRPTRYTFELAENAERMSFCFFGEEYRPALRLCGTKSGRDCDKIAEAGLSVLYDEKGTPYFEQAETVVFGRKLYADFLTKDNFIISEPLKNYNANDFHKFYVCEIEDVLKRSY